MFIHIHGYDTAIDCNQLRGDSIIVANDIKDLNGYDMSSFISFIIDYANQRLKRVILVQLKIRYINLRS